jgi:hypothetical protein
MRVEKELHSYIREQAFLAECSMSSWLRKELGFNKRVKRKTKFEGPGNLRKVIEDNGASEEEPEVEEKFADEEPEDQGVEVDGHNSAELDHNSAELDPLTSPDDLEPDPEQEMTDVSEDEPEVVEEKFVDKEVPRGHAPNCRCSMCQMGN